MIIYLHGFDSTSPGNHEKILQLKFIDPDVRFVTYSTRHPKHDMSHILKEIKRELDNSNDKSPLLVGVGLGGYWSERVAFLSGIRSVIFNPNLHPQDNMVGKIDRPEEYADIGTKCVSAFREKNKEKCLCILSTQDETLNNRASAEELEPYYKVIWDDQQTHKFKSIAAHLPAIQEFKQQDL
ncbi:alpha/beta hydrolase YcfP [Echinimonas agarilytica]|uniref:UPF0227 protein NAF29_09335 n=1 Tax=Echinimonas agarilytica TaxID=1215918 RepID=A0AA41W753_9GAMM|nr:alpha/beta hydrolase YcfP [Echinimonas agarilytica]MCM2679866.1 alpha/beta hydrolase YcfP [Echinimonas agarilytica]